MQRVTLISLVALALPLACGGAAPPAKSGPSETPATSESSTAPVTSTAAPNAAASSTQAAKPAGASAANEALVKAGLQLLDRRAIELDFDLNLTTKKGGSAGVQSGQWSFAEERSLRVKTVKDELMTELQVVYGKWEAKPLLGLEYRVPTDGKTYLATAAAGKLTFSRGQDEKLSSDEQRAVEAEYGWVGGKSPLRAALLDAKTPGASLPRSVALTRALLGELPGVDATKAKVEATIKEQKSGPRPTVLLEVHATTRIVSLKTTFELDLTGPLEVDLATGWVRSANLTGTVVASGEIENAKKGTLVVSGKGKVKVTRSAEFR